MHIISFHCTTIHNLGVFTGNEDQIEIVTFLILFAFFRIKMMCKIELIALSYATLNMHNLAIYALCIRKFCTQETTFAENDKIHNSLKDKIVLMYMYIIMHL